MSRLGQYLSQKFWSQNKILHNYLSLLKYDHNLYFGRTNNEILSFYTKSRYLIEK